MAKYLLDKSVSRFTVRARASGMLSVIGHNPTIAIRDFKGEVEFDPATPDGASLRLEIRANSLEVTDDISGSDRREIESTMNQKVLESAAFPAITFTTNKVSSEALGEGRYRLKVTGDLSLRGVTRSLTLTPQVSIAGELLRAYGEFSILQSDFGIAPVSVAGGALKLKDQLEFAYDLAGREQS